MAELPGRASAKHRLLAGGAGGVEAWLPLHELGANAVDRCAAPRGPDEAEALVDLFSDEEHALGGGA
jgi:hypothetical protein